MLAIFDADEIEQIVTEELGGSALFASRFRECAGRALLLPRRNPARRSPLWQQRQRAAGLLKVASKYGSFPIVLETMRECLQDVFDVPGLVGLMRDIAARKVRVVEVETEQASPFAASLLFAYIGAFMYEGDAPLAERRAQALSLDTHLLAELLGEADLRELLDPDVVADTERELARLDRPLRDARGSRRSARDPRPAAGGGRHRARGRSRLAGRAGGGPPGHPDPRRRGRAVGGRGGRRQDARRARGSAADGGAARLPGAGRRSARRSARPARAHTRPVPRHHGGRPVRARRRGGRRRPAPAGRGGQGGVRRVQAGRPW